MFVSVIGFLMIMIFMFTSAHILLNLFVRSSVTSLAYEAARIASAEDGTPAEAEAFLAQQLGGRLVSAQVGPAGDVVVASVTAQGPSLAPRQLGGALNNLTQIQVNVQARVEQPVGGP